MTLATVAERAGVTKGTASRALNGQYGVSAATRDRVVAAAAELGFAPDEVARSLTTGRSGTVGLLTSDLSGRFALPVMLGAERALSTDHGASVLLSDARRDPGIEAARLRSLLSRRVDGILIVGDRSDPRPAVDGALPVPVVYVYAPSDDPRDVSIVVDEVGGGYLAARHLIDRGCRRIVHVGGRPDFLAAHERLAGVERALAESGLSLAAPARLGEWGPAWGERAVTELLDEGVEFDGVVGASDFVARGATTALLDRGLRVPDDVKVIGFDNSPTIAPYPRPALSAVDLNLGRLGEVAVDALLDLQNGAPREGVLALPGFVVERDSTGG